MSRFRDHILRLILKVPALAQEAHPNFVKAQIPPAVFTRKGPGVTAMLRAVLRGFTQGQMAIAHQKGWDRGLLKKTSSGNYQLHR